MRHDIQNVLLHGMCALFPRRCEQCLCRPVVGKRYCLVSGYKKIREFVAAAAAAAAAAANN